MASTAHAAGPPVGSLGSSVALALAAKETIEGNADLVAPSRPDSHPRLNLAQMPELRATVRRSSSSAGAGLAALSASLRSSGSGIIQSKSKENLKQGTDTAQPPQVLSPSINPAQLLNTATGAASKSKLAGNQQHHHTEEHGHESFSYIFSDSESEPMREPVAKTTNIAMTPEHKSSLSTTAAMAAANAGMPRTQLDWQGGVNTGSAMQPKTDPATVNIAHGSVRFEPNKSGQSHVDPTVSRAATPGVASGTPNPSYMHTAHATSSPVPAHAGSKPLFNTYPSEWQHNAVSLPPGTVAPAASIPFGQSGYGPGDWKDEQDRLDILVTENDELVEKTRRLTTKNATLKDQLMKYSKTLTSNATEMETFRGRVREMETEMEKMRRDVTVTDRDVRETTEELAHAHADLNTLREDLRHRDILLDERDATIDGLKKTLAELGERYHAHIKEADERFEREKELLDELKIRTTELEECQTHLTQSTKETETLKTTTKNLNDANQNLETRITSLERAELQSIQEMQRHRHEADEALFERDKAIERESRLKSEVCELNTKLVELPVKYAEKNEAAIQLLRSQFQIDRRKFAEETSKLETLCATLQNQVERAIREKRAAESELDKVTRHVPGEADRLTMTIEELHCKLRASERERNESVHKLESVHQRFVREQNRYEADRSQLAHRLDDAQRRLRKAERELEESKQERVTILSKMATLDTEITTLQQTIKKKQTQHDIEIASIVRKHDEQVVDLTNKADAATDAHSRTCREMQQLLLDQRRLGDKWKEEATRMTETHETALDQLRAQLTHHKTRMTELESQLQRASARYRDVMDQLGREKRDQAALVARCAHAESRVETLGGQISLLVGKETELLEERKKLQRELDRATLERDRFQKDAKQHTRSDMGISNARMRVVTDGFNHQIYEAASPSRIEAINRVESTRLTSGVEATLANVSDLEAEIARVKQRSRGGPHTPVAMVMMMDSSEDSD